MPRLMSSMGTVPLGGRGGIAESTASECSSSFMVMFSQALPGTGTAAMLVQMDAVKTLLVEKSLIL